VHRSSGVGLGGSFSLRRKPHRSSDQHNAEDYQAPEKQNQLLATKKMKEATGQRVTGTGIIPRIRLPVPVSLGPDLVTEVCPP
jgi:hypothetical protein